VTSHTELRDTAVHALESEAARELAALGDPRQWMERNLHIRTKCRRVIPFLLNSVQSDYYDGRTQRDIILKPRQLGFTTLICALFFADAMVRENTTSVMVAHDSDSSERIFRIVQLFWERLPGRERAKAGKPRFSNRREFLWPQINSHFFVGTAGATTFGRGQTINNLHCSEFAFWPSPREALTALTEAVPEDGRIVIESTANGMGSAFHQLWDAAREATREASGDGRANYRRHFYVWWQDPSYRLDGRPLEGITAEEADLQAKHRLDEAQLRWRRLKQADLGDQFPQEYPEDDLSCFLRSGRGYFNLLRAHEIAQRESREPIRSEGDGRLRVWGDPREGRVYAISADTAKGKQKEEPAGGSADERGGPDYSVAIVQDWLTGEQVAEWHARDVREFPFAHVLYGLWQRYPGIIIPERNGPGEVVAQRLQELDPKCVYRDEDGEPGWVNTHRTRLAALGLLAQGIERDTVPMRSEGFWREVQTFVTNSATGRPEAAPGFHDDRVLAVAMGMLVRQKTPPPRPSPGDPEPLPSYGHDWDPGTRTPAPPARRVRRR
jgi:hypothetical protein